MSHDPIPEPLCAAAFAPFGEVIAHTGDAPLWRVPSAFDHGPEAADWSLSVLRVERAVAFPLTITRLERHPFSAQSFLPLLRGTSLVVVCLANSAGAPDPATLRVFVATDRQGVVYRRGVWHRSVGSLEAPAEYAVLMAHTGRNDDTEFHDLAEPFRVTAALPSE